jgi:hypothetical protein
MTLLDSDLARFDLIGLSHVTSHERTCCGAVRHQIFAQLGQQQDLGSALAAVSDLIPWGPVRWPIHWCELLTDDGLVGDCGVHADVTSRLLTSHLVSHVRGRAALLALPLTLAHWRATWREADVSTAWIGQSSVHHEVIRVGDRWWDPSEARWFPGAGAHVISGRVVALREEDGSWQLDSTAAAHSGT